MSETRCTFEVSWVGRCNNISVPEDALLRCSKHAIDCCSCGKPATHDCDHTGIQFVCGAPLCDNCAHNAPPKDDAGMFMLGGGHCDKKTADKNWMKRYGLEEA